MLTQNELNKMNSLLAKADSSQMRMINGMFNDQHKAKQQMAKNSFVKGQKVFFMTKNQQRQEGVVTKVMIKNIQVDTAEGGIWRVSPILLKAC